MYQLDLRRQAYKDLESIPADYARLIQRNSKATRVILCALERIASFMTLMIKPKSQQFIASNIVVRHTGNP